MWFLYTWVIVSVVMVIICRISRMSLFLASELLWFLRYSDLTQICIQFFVFIIMRIFTFFFFFSFPITKFLYIDSYFLFLYLIIFLIFLSFLCFSLIYSGNAIQVCPTYYWFDFSTKLLSSTERLVFSVLIISTDLYYVLFTMLY